MNKENVHWKMVNETRNWKHYFSFRFLRNKLREKGLFSFFKSGVLKIGVSWWLYPARIFLRRLIYLLSWLFPVLRVVFRHSPETQKRILAIWDFRIEPFTVGELLLLHEVALMLREIHKVDKIDLIFLWDKNNPTNGAGGLNVSNFYNHFSELLQLAFVNVHLGAVFVMDSPDMLSSYIADNHKRYHIFPPYKDSDGNKITGHDQLFIYASLFYSKHGYVPYLSCQPSTLMWARKFLFDNVHPLLPVTVQLRNTSTVPERNAELDCWIEFFTHCLNKYPVKFIMIGRGDEIDPRFRKLSNVLVAKDYCTTLEQDLALMQAAFMYMGTDSGPGVMALFSDRPYAYYRYYLLEKNGSIPSDYSLPWATELQKIVWGPETTDRLISDFRLIYDNLDKVQWAADFDRLASEASEKLKRTSPGNNKAVVGLGSKKGL
jgi:hypothetical protein